MPQRLQSLELQGYKTFASRTIFEYSGAITAIVGPNGSGKSNIADAIRWVLGEQSFSVLRGRKTEDMIFSGSESRPRASMASASMVFDNTDQWLPIDFSEVAITRRAYRDGQNEYLINGQRVRLKDVTELLAGSGLAERTYTVIGQGLVDVALALKAEERRQLFEEAAGIGLYRSRREEALRRLEATKRNLERVRDILSELSPRLQSLEKQARRYEEYEQIRKDLKVLLLEWYGYHWHREQKELILAKEIVQKREKALKAAREKINETDEQISKIKSEILCLRNEQIRNQQKLAEINQKLSACTQHAAVLNERQQALQKSQLGVEADSIRVEEELRYNEEMVLEAEKDVLQAEQEYTEAREKSSLAQAEFANIEQEYQSIESQLKTLRVEFEGGIRKKAELEASTREAALRIERLQELWRERKKSQQLVEAEISHLNQEGKDLQSQLEKLLSDHQRVGETLREWNLREQNLIKERDEKLERVKKIEGELVRLTTQLEILEQADTGLVDYNQAARHILGEKDSRNRWGVLGVLGPHLSIPIELETAISAIVGEFTDAILIKGENEAEAVIEVLNREKLRGILFPIETHNRDSNHTERRITIPKELKERVIGWCSDLVSSEGEFQEAVKRLFGNFLIVKDRQTAKSLIKSLNSPPVFVTLQGEVFYPNGVIVSAGSEEAGKIRRPRQKREISIKIGELRELLSTVKKEIHDLENQVMEIRGKLKEVEQQRERVMSGIEMVEKKQRENRSILEQAQSRMDGLIKTAQKEQDEVNQLTSKMADWEGQRNAILEMIEGLEEKIRQKSEQLAMTSIDSIKAQIGQWDVYLKAAERALINARGRYAERIGQKQKNEETIRRLENQKNELQNSLRELEVAIAQELQQIQTLEEEKKDVAEGIFPIEVELREKEQKLEQVNAEMRKIQDGIIQLEQHYAQARISFTRQQERFEALRRKIEEDFGLVAFEYDEAVSGPTPLPLDGMVEKLPIVQQLPVELEENIKRYRTQLRRVGPINPDAQLEYEQVKTRYEFLLEQIQDLESAEKDIKEIIGELDATMQHDFRETFEAVAEEFKIIFGRLFSGGSAKLILNDEEDLSQAGIEIEARLPGKRMQGLSLLSGGERSLTAVALIFALLKISPTPFCVLDEVDAMLDETNVGRFRELLKELSANTQFIIVTHNRNTVQVADVIYGVTMGKDSTSQVISLKLDELDKVIRESV